MPPGYSTAGIVITCGRNVQEFIGEACHAFDTCIAIAGSPLQSVFAESFGSTDERTAMDENLFATVRHRNGSISQVAYLAAGDLASPREQIEVRGGGRTAILTDWSMLTLWRGGKRSKISLGFEKGQREELQVFAQAVKQGGPWPVDIAETLNSAATPFAAIESLRTDLPVDVEF